MKYKKRLPIVEYEDYIKDWDYVIENNSDYDSLKSKVAKLIEELK